MDYKVSYILFLLFIIFLYGCLYPTNNMNGMQINRTEIQINDQLDFSPTQLELSIFYAINDVRKSYNKTALDYDLRASYVARQYSQRMLREGFFDHYDKEGKNVNDRLKEANISYSTVGENLALITFDKNSVNKTIEGWLKSEKHRKTMLDDIYSKLGVGIACGKELCYITTVYLNKTFINELPLNGLDKKYLIVTFPLNGPALLKLKFDNNVMLFLTKNDQIEKIKNNEQFVYYKRFYGKAFTVFMQKDDSLLIYGNETTLMTAEIING